jgi:hypothetical protein
MSSVVVVAAVFFKLVFRLGLGSGLRLRGTMENGWRLRDPPREQNIHSCLYKWENPHKMMIVRRIPSFGFVLATTMIHLLK